MRSMKFIVAGSAVAVIAMSLAPAALPQQPSAQQSDQGQVIKREVRLVNILASVRDKKKHMVTNLKQEDFHVFENDQEQKIAFFSNETTLPITLGLLIDTSGSEQNRLPAEQGAASGFLQQVMKNGDEAMVISFDIDVDLLADFTDDKAKLNRAINSARVNAPNAPVTPGTFPSGPDGTHFYDAIYTSCSDKLSSEAGRKALVIVTDAEDFGSKVTVQEAIEAAERTDTVVHILLVHDPGYGTRPDIAKRIADATGGRVIDVSSMKHIREAFDQISEELRNQYTLGYYPTNGAPDGKFRKLKVEANDKDLHVLARKGYYAPRE